MRAPALLFVAIAIFVLAAPASAGNDKQLQNVHGQVAYQKGAAAQKPIAPSASVSLADSDYAITGPQSLAAVGLPDSSRVLVGAASKIQLVFFNQAEGNNARFIVYDGSVRFEVRHPAGAKSNYTFQTPTASIAVRGTQGDIVTAQDSVRVNVYEVCDPSLPVVVTTKDGQSFQLVPGQSLFAQIVNGRVRAEVQQLTQQLIDQVSPDFGVPHSWDEMQQRITAYAQNGASATISSTVGSNPISNAIPNVGGLFHKQQASPSPSPSPSSAPATCSHA